MPCADYYKGMSNSARGRYEVSLASVGNPDFGQDPTRPLYGVKNTLAIVDSLAAAARACRKWIEDNDLGSGNWVGGKVIDRTTKQQVAQISYNGRIWNPGPYPQPEITDDSLAADRSAS